MRISKVRAIVLDYRLVLIPSVLTQQFRKYSILPTRCKFIGNPDVDNISDAEESRTPTEKQSESTRLSDFRF